MEQRLVAALPRALRKLMSSGVTAVVEVESGEVRGEIHLDGGHIVYARSPAHEGFRALKELVGRGDSRYVVRGVGAHDRGTLPDVFAPAVARAELARGPLAGHAVEHELAPESHDDVLEVLDDDVQEAGPAWGWPTVLPPADPESDAASMPAVPAAPSLPSEAMRDSARPSNPTTLWCLGESSPPKAPPAPVPAAPSRTVPQAKAGRGRARRLVLPVLGVLIALLAWMWVGERERASAGRVPTERMPASALVAHRAARVSSMPELTTAQSGLAPTLVLRVLVGPDGRAREAEVKDPRDGLSQLEQQALTAALAARYEPAVENGVARESWLDLPLRFLPRPTARRVRVKGSDTIGGALGPAWARGFEALRPGVSVEVSALGSSTAFSGLLDGSADVGASSRPMRSDELDVARGLGVTLREFIAGHDGIAVVVHRDSPLASLSLPELGRLFAGSASSVPTERGEFSPDRLYGRPSYSGTHTFFVERVLGKGPARPLASEFVAVESSSQIVSLLATEPRALGFVSFGWVQGDGARALALAREPGGRPVAPSAETIRSGDYPLARPLYLYVRADADADTRAFVDFALSPAGQALAREHGFVDVAEPVTQPLLEGERASAQAQVPDVQRVYFGVRGTALDAEARVTLQALAARLGRAEVVYVRGNSDARGDATANKTLALARAQAVASALAAFGVPRRALRVEAGDYPLASNNTPTGRDENRRVDILYRRTE